MNTGDMIFAFTDLTISWVKQTGRGISMWCDEHHDEKSSWDVSRASHPSSAQQGPCPNRSVLHTETSRLNRDNPEKQGGGGKVMYQHRER